MKTFKYALLTAVTVFLFAVSAEAQRGRVYHYRYAQGGIPRAPQQYSPKYNSVEEKRYFFNVDWQYNFPLDNGFADKSSGWGMNFEGGYYLTPYWGIGAFLAFHTNNEYIPRETIRLANGAITTDRQHSLYQLPFGVSGRYRFLPASIVQPYIAVKAGANYSRVTAEYYIYETFEKCWGFYVSPEIGTDINFTRRGDIGLHVAAYYSYATNKADVLNYSVDGLSNFGLRVGLKF